METGKTAEGTPDIAYWRKEIDKRDKIIKSLQAQLKVYEEQDLPVEFFDD